MARRYSGSRVALAMCALALGVSSVGIALKTAMTACGEVTSLDPETSQPTTRYLFEWDECAGGDRLRDLQTRIVLWGATGVVALTIAGIAMGTAPVASEPDPVSRGQSPG